MKRVEKQNNLLFRVAAVLLLGVLLTMRLFAGLPARYTTNSEGSDGARVARYALTVQAVTPNVTKHTVYFSNEKDDSKDFLFTVTNKNAKSDVCEVALRYTVHVTVPAPLAPEVTLRLNGADATSIVNDGTTYVFDQGKTFQPSQLHTYEETLSFVVTSEYDGMTYIDFNQKRAGLSSAYSVYFMDPFIIDVVATQID